MSRILVVDDEANIRELIKKYASFEGYEVFEAVDGMDAVEKVSNNDYDIIVMDVMMPELDGFSAVKEIRKIKNTPIIMLSARGEEYDRLHGFDLGIDDYVVKPFSPKELMMRIAAIMNRYRSAVVTNQNVFTFGDLKIDYDARIVTISDERIELTPKEYELLTYLIKNENIAVTRETLLTKIWGYDFFGDDRTLDTHLKSLRKKIGVYGQNIITLRGVGYRFETK
ncbi:MAG: response regulator transcription factor [Bacilli bacterium]|nr:response regulator transcription factor [Bacilli bacterium]